MSVCRAVCSPHLYRMISIALVGVSACVIFAEATIGAGRHPDLSPFSIMVHHEKNRVEISLQMLVLIPLVPPHRRPPRLNPPSTAL